jgi:hypothetical protein
VVVSRTVTFSFLRMFYSNYVRIFNRFLFPPLCRLSLAHHTVEDINEVGFWGEKWAAFLCHGIGTTGNILWT